MTTLLSAIGGRGTDSLSSRSGSRVVEKFKTGKNGRSQIPTAVTHASRSRIPASDLDKAMGALRRDPSQRDGPA